ncbi:MAG TPA: hypothetical protein VH186_16265 [Chloroflexia bacterium]|nr:hypothetical protein [Chloroflexia bacterium]
MIESSTAQKAARRPFGVIVLCGLQIISLLIELADLARLIWQVKFIPGPRWNGDWQAQVALNTLFFIVGLSFLIGLWQMKKWAWIMLMVYLSASMGLDLISYFSGKETYIPMVISVIMVFYLNLREVRQAYEIRV